MADVILVYHSIDDLGTSLSVSPEAFAEQMRTLKRRGVGAVTVSELLSGSGERPRVAVTFDDGFASVPRRALPLLERLGFRATVFPIARALGSSAAWIDDDGPLPALELMAPRELGLLAGAGWEIASHTSTHRCCLALASARWTQELHDSREILNALSGAPIRGFAYPYGCHDADAVAAVRAAGYEWACTTIPGSAARSPSPYALRRVTIGRTTTRLRFRAATCEPIQALRRLSPAHRRIAAGRHAHAPMVGSVRFT